MDHHAILCMTIKKWTWQWRVVGALNKEIVKSMDEGLKIKNNAVKCAIVLNW